MDKSNASEYIPLIQALARGETIEASYDSGVTWRTLEVCDFSMSASRYRIKTEMKLRPWSPQEIPVGALLRMKAPWKSEYGGMLVSTILAASEIAFTYCGGANGMIHVAGREFPVVLERCEHSTDGGKTWLPCGVLE